MTASNCLNDFDSNPYVIFRPYNIHAHDKIRDIVYNAVHCSARKLYDIHIDSLEQIHSHIPSQDINEFRLEAYKQINDSNISELLYLIQAPILGELLGSDLAIQKSVNLSIVPPNDLSSTIPFHSDINTGESLYELVSWIPFTDCSGSNSIFLADPSESLALHSNLGTFNSHDSIGLNHYANDCMKINHLNISKQECLLFSPILFHGSSINQTDITRVSINLRFKNTFSPYIHHDCEGKGLNDFFRVLKKSKLSRFVDLYQAPSFL